MSTSYEIRSDVHGNERLLHHFIFVSVVLITFYSKMPALVYLQMTLLTLCVSHFLCLLCGRFILHKRRKHRNLV